MDIDDEGIAMAFPHLIRPSDVAELFDVSERTVCRWIAERKLPSVRIGGTTRVFADELMRFVDTNRDLLQGDADDE